MNETYLKNNPKYKALYQDYDWCYYNFFTLGLNHDEMAKLGNTTKRTIEKWCVEKHRITGEYRCKNKNLNNLQRSVIIGNMLGDGHIDKREEKPLFIVSHCEKQKEYLYWKYDILKDFCNKPPSFIKGRVAIFNKKEYNRQPSYRVSTRVSNCFLEFRGKSYSFYLDRIDEVALSVWVLDDGHRSRSGWSLCFAQYTEEDKIKALDILKSKFGLKAKILQDNRYLNFDSESSRRLDSIILSNIPNDIDIIRHKILECNISKKIDRVFYNGEFLIDYCKKNDLNYKRVIYKKNKGISIKEAIKQEDYYD